MQQRFVQLSFPLELIRVLGQTDSQCTFIGTLGV
ncbi:hypothetical protein LINPERHAP1_LOCUS24965 [Linum perenne]